MRSLARITSLHDRDLSLTAYRVDILRYLSTGKSPSEIAGALRIAVGTVYEHVESVRKHLGARSTAELIRMAIHHGFVDAGAS